MRNQGKKFSTAVILLFCVTIISLPGSAQKTDTVKWHNVVLVSSVQNGKKIFMADDVPVDSTRYTLLQKEWGNNPLANCRPCYLLELDAKDRKIKEGDFFVNIPIGIYKEYYAGGKLKISGTYKNVYPLTHADFQMGVPCIDKCTVKEGEWKYYSAKGIL